MAGGRGRVLRLGRRVPHVVPLPGHAAAVHGAAHGGPVPDHRHPGADPGDPRDLPVGDVPAQPRRAHARDGDRRGPGLHVPGLRRRAAGADQPGDPPAAGASAGQRPAPHRADERPPDGPARHADRLLRRRDRHGRQLLPGRQERRAHPDAVEPGQKRRLLGRQPAQALPAGDHRPRVPLRGGQRRDPAGEPPLAALVDAPDDRPAQALPGLRPGLDRVPPARQPPRPGVHPPPRRRADPDGRQPLALRPARRARPGGVPRRRAHRAVRAHAVPGDRRAALPAHPGPPRLLLVLARRRAGRPATAPGRLAAG